MSTETDRIRSHLQEAAQLLEQVLADDALLAQANEAANIMIQSLKNGGKIIACGNGGSHCDAMHFAEELSGRYRNSRPGLPAMAISDASHITCVGNDYGFEHIFARHIEAFGKPGDVLLAISTSGNSPNVLAAITAARKALMKVVVFSGKDGGKMRHAADAEIIVPHFGYADRIQEIHIKLVHALIDSIEHGLGLA